MPRRLTGPPVPPVVQRHRATRMPTTAHACRTSPFRRFWPPLTSVPHDPGLAASPPERCTLKGDPCKNNLNRMEARHGRLQETIPGHDGCGVPVIVIRALTRRVLCPMAVPMSPCESSVAPSPAHHGTTRCCSCGWRMASPRARIPCTFSPAAFLAATNGRLSSRPS